MFVYSAMYDFVLFIIILILIAASVALIYLILSSDSSKNERSKSDREELMISEEISQQNIELMKKFYNTFTDEEINRFKQIDKRVKKR